MTTLADAIRRELPYLRRCARALIGSQALGDAAVRSCLEQLAETPDAIGDIAPRLGLFRLLNRHIAERHDGASRERDQPSFEDGAILISRLGSLPFAARQALILTTLESFSKADAALILDTDVETLTDLVARASEAMDGQPRSRVLVIEDEALIALDIADMVRQLGHEVVGIAATHGEALEIARAERPGLVLADIQLADNSSGVDAVHDILEELAQQVPVIFITAFPERLLTGERPEPTFLITKPFDARLLTVAIAQALSTHPVEAAPT